MQWCGGFVHMASWVVHSPLESPLQNTTASLPTLDALSRPSGPGAWVYTPMPLKSSSSSCMLGGRLTKAALARACAALMGATR